MVVATMPQPNISDWPKHISKATEASVIANRPFLIQTPEVDCFDSYSELPVTRASEYAMLVFKFQGLHSVLPLRVTLECHDGFIEVEHEDLGIFGRGATSSEAFQDFMESLIADYRVYAEEDDNKLDKYALELARRYRQTFVRE